MGIFRLYTNGDGKSQIEELDLASHPELAEAVNTQHIFSESGHPVISLIGTPPPNGST